MSSESRNAESEPQSLAESGRTGTRVTAVLLVLALLASLGLAYGAYSLAGYSWDQVVDYRTPYAEIDPATLVGERIAEDGGVPGATQHREVFVIIDGLTLEASRDMESLNALRERGVEVVATSGEPSLSFPNWTTLLTGAPQHISGVTTNWFEERVQVETLLDVAIDSGRRTVVAGPTDLDMLYGAARADGSAFTDWVEDSYMSSGIVDDALRFADEVSPEFVIVHFPDIDEAGHAEGAASQAYADMVARVDADLTRLIDGLDDGSTVFVVAADHGHIATGGHGGWEPEVLRVPAIFAGPGIATGMTAEAAMTDIAPTAAVAAGMHSPRQSWGTAIDEVFTAPSGTAYSAEQDRAAAFRALYAAAVRAGSADADDDAAATPAASPEDGAALAATAESDRLAADRAGRTGLLALAIGFAVALLIVISLASWRALVAALAGAAVYHGVYNALFALLHGYTWSLSTFNDEAQIQAFFNGRMLETVIAALVGCVVAAEIYLLLRPEPKGARRGFVVGWLALGAATVLVIQATLATMVGVFLRDWGPSVTWILPNMRSAFKYDLDLIQMTALGAAALLGPAVTFLIGRFHPRVAKQR